MNILIADDEKDMLKIVYLYLKNEGYHVTMVSNGREAMEELERQSFDLLILDWMMPFMDGMELCREVRAMHIPVKIILLTAKGEIGHEIIGLECGADDFIRKPFDPKILLLRVRRLLGIKKLLVCGELSLNMDTKVVKKGVRELKLSRKEYELLQFLLLNQGIIISRETLLDRVWGIDYDGNERTVDTHIKRLRDKIGGDNIATHVGMGYTITNGKKSGI